MNIKISENALEMIKKATETHVDKIPTVCVFKGGCAGTMLGIQFLQKTVNSEIIHVNNIEIAISKEVSKIAQDISIDVKNGILPAIIIINNSAEISCKCGKSFKI